MAINMRKIIAVLLAGICLFSLAACGEKDSNKPYFIAKVTELEEATVLIEITDKGSSGVSVGSKARISNEKIAGVLSDDPNTVTNNFIHVEFDGVVMETHPLQLGEIFQITVTNEKGDSIE